MLKKYWQVSAIFTDTDTTSRYHKNRPIPPILILEYRYIPRENLKHFHFTITSQYFSFRKNNKVTNTTPMRFIHQNKHYHIICIQNCTAQSQQITTLKIYLHTVNPDTYMPQCPLCLSNRHDINQ